MERAAIGWSQAGRQQRCNVAAALPPCTLVCMPPLPLRRFACPHLLMAPLVESDQWYCSLIGRMATLMAARSTLQMSATSALSPTTVTHCRSGSDSGMSGAASPDGSNDGKGDAADGAGWLGAEAGGEGGDGVPEAGAAAGACGAAPVTLCFCSSAAARSACSLLVDQRRLHGRCARSMCRLRPVSARPPCRPAGASHARRIAQLAGGCLPL